MYHTFLSSCVYLVLPHRISSIIWSVCYCVSTYGLKPVQGFSRLSTVSVPNNMFRASPSFFDSLLEVISVPIFSIVS